MFLNREMKITSQELTLFWIDHIKLRGNENKKVFSVVFPYFLGGFMCSFPLQWRFIFEIIREDGERRRCFMELFSGPGEKVLVRCWLWQTTEEQKNDLEPTKMVRSFILHFSTEIIEISKNIQQFSQPTYNETRF